MDNNDLPHLPFGQKASIVAAARLGKVLQERHAEIADFYRRGYSLKDIAEEFAIGHVYGVDMDVARNGVHKAIAGNDGILGTPCYKGLISENERKELSNKNRLNNVKQLMIERRGIHAQTPEERKMYGAMGCSLGGIISGRKTYEEGTGVHGLSARRRRKIVLSVIRSKGLTPWTSRERNDAYRLSQTPEYKRDNEKISGALNKKYHGRAKVRTWKSVQVMLTKVRKSLEEKAEEGN